METVTLKNAVVSSLKDLRVLKNHIA